MSILLLILVAFLPTINFVLPTSKHFWVTILSQLIIGGYTSFAVIEVFGGGGSAVHLNDAVQSEVFFSDPLTAIFITLINVVCIATSFYSKGYLKPYADTKTRSELAVHSLAIVWLHISMICVVVFRSGFPFLAAWEVMTLASFILVMFEAEKKETFWVGLSYLIQMHVGFFFILAGFVVAFGQAGTFGFDGLASYFSSNNNLPLFLLFLVGFGLKAGFFPLHTWLPNAHPAAPSHVSAAMSGIMIKMGVYGLIRVLLSLQQQYLEVGLILLSIGLLTGLWGVVSAILQKDIKRVLAYSSIENIGIIGIGLGLGFVGLYLQSKSMAVLAFTGAILHIVNHGLFKPMLFMGAGSVYLSTHTRRADDLGGLIKRMPQTALLFIAGSIAICALPPFNGFVSELFIYVGMFNGIVGESLRESIILITGILILALIGGLSIFAFTKVVGVTFLGAARKPNEHVHEVNKWMLIPQYVLLAMMLCIGIFPRIALKFIGAAVSQFPIKLPTTMLDLPFQHSLDMITIVALVFAATLLVLFFLRSKVQQDKPITNGPTWGCGYCAVDSTQQYTSTSHAESLISITKPLVKVTQDFEPIAEADFFPHDGSFKSGSNDPFEELVTARPTNRLTKLLKRVAILQTGLIQHYVLYALIFIIGILVLTYFSLI